MAFDAPGLEKTRSEQRLIRAAEIITDVIFPIHVTWFMARMLNTKLCGRFWFGCRGHLKLSITAVGSSTFPESISVKMLKLRLLLQLL